MKKVITEQKVQRMRNIVMGKYGKKTEVQTGYVRKEAERKEGDVWEARGKTWTVKNGIIRNITKTSAARKALRLPLCCPECGNRMKKRLDKKFYDLKKRCFDCQVAFEHVKRIDGTYDEYEKKQIQENAEQMYKTAELMLNDYLKDAKSQHYITEAGQLEDWSGGHSESDLKNLVEHELKTLRTKIDTYKEKKNAKTN